MTTDESVTHGVALEDLESFVDFAVEHPEAVEFTLEAESIYEGTCAHSLAKIAPYTLGDETIDRDTREYTVPYGGWKEVLETAGWVTPTDRMEPIEVALSALAACINVGISLNAVANGVDIDDLTTRVRADFNPAVLFNIADLDDADAVFDNITADIDIDAPDIDKDQIDEWARRAPVYTLVSMAQDLHVTVNTPAQLEADD